MKRPKIIIEPGTLAEVEYLQNTREWRALTPKQRAFLTVALTTGDAKQATLKAYPTVTSDACRRSLQSQVLHSLAVTDFLEIWKWRNSREALLAVCRENLKAAPPGSTAASSLTVQIERLELGIQGSNKAHFKGPASTAATEHKDPQAPIENVATSRVPVGATPLVDDQGIVRGYRTAENEYVQLSDVEVSR
jgi:hypothetical protein